MIQRRLRVVKWLSTHSGSRGCTLCGQEFKVPMSALRRTADAQAFRSSSTGISASPQDSNHVGARVPADALLRQEPDEEEGEEEDDRKEDDDDDEGDGYSE